MGETHQRQKARRRRLTPQCIKDCHFSRYNSLQFGRLSDSDHRLVTDSCREHPTTGVAYSGLVLPKGIRAKGFWLLHIGRCVEFGCFTQGATLRLPNEPVLCNSGNLRSSQALDELTLQPTLHILASFYRTGSKRKAFWLLHIGRYIEFCCFTRGATLRVPYEPILCNSWNLRSLMVEQIWATQLG